jgi:hypothetical protein
MGATPVFSWGCSELLIVLTADVDKVMTDLYIKTLRAFVTLGKKITYHL